MASILVTKGPLASAVFQRLLAMLLCAVPVACSTVPTPQDRVELADGLTDARGWVTALQPAGPFDLKIAFSERLVTNRHLVVFIEGDGFAWRTRSRPSADPTPVNPVGLKMALNHPAGNAVYLARPCQYRQRNCESRFWTGARFAPEVIDAMGLALDGLKRRFGAEALTLVGYSGGGAVAALLAAERADVQRLVTVAGNLDHAAWTKHHRVSPLAQSLNPIDVAGALAGVEQTHFVGAEDRIVPPQLIEPYIASFDRERRPKLIVKAGFDHACCWAEEWASLWASIGAGRRD